jgi:KaiC/GvpD/RAD55 family RecA-like ATPase
MLSWLRSLTRRLRLDDGLAGSSGSIAYVELYSSRPSLIRQIREVTCNYQRAEHQGMFRILNRLLDVTSCSGSIFPLSLNPNE